MNAPVDALGGTAAIIERAVAALGDGPLTEAGVATHIAPLFSRVLERRKSAIDLANHSLGRALDATAADVTEAIVLWQRLLGEAWDPWFEEMGAYRRRLAALLRAPRADCVVPKSSAGQGLRAVLNTYDRVPRVVATRGEFDSIDLILRQYARRGRISLALVEPRADGLFVADDLRAAVRRGADLLVVSQVLFDTGQVLPELRALIGDAQAAGARVLVDVYHALGAMPVDIGALDADFAIGGSYKYLRGGPGACFLYLHPRHLDGSLSTLDTGWFAKRDRFAYQRPDPPEFAPGGDAFFESTPPILPLYQARAGQVFTLAMGAERLRAYGLRQLQRLRGLLQEQGIDVEGGTPDRGAFAVLRDAHAVELATVLQERGLHVDARGPYLRLCPDALTTDAELVAAARLIAAARADRNI
jgi:kynureninase